MEKKTFEQIMEIVKENFDDIESFNYLKLPRDWVESENAQAATVLKKKYYEDNNRPQYNTPEYEIYINMHSSGDMKRLE